MGRNGIGGLKRFSSVLAVCGALALPATSPASSADLGTGEAPVTADQVSPWTVEVGGYAFIPLSVEGTSTVNGGSVNLDLGPSEIFDLLQFAFSGRIEAWRARSTSDGSAFGIVFDGQYVNLGLSNSRIVGGTATQTVRADIRQGIVDLMAGYRLPSIQTGATSSQRLEFDVLAGARYNYLRQKIEVIPGLPAPFTVNLGGDRNWVSPVIGARANFIFNDKWNMVFRGDMSGFGVSGERLSWSLAGIAGYRFTEKAAFRFGYRVYDIDYSDGTGANRFGYDVTQHGPFLGLSYRF